jgi:hypothetical protein
VDIDFRYPSAEAWIEELRAEEKLAHMDIAEDLALLAESEASPRLRRQLSDRYRATAGVRPELRHELRSAMKRVIAGGGMPVEAVIDLINRDSRAMGAAGTEERFSACEGIFSFSA